MAPNSEAEKRAAAAAGTGAGSSFDISLHGKRIGSATVDVYSTTSSSTHRGATIQITPDITDPSQAQYVFRWRQRFTVTDQNGNFLDWRGIPANNVLDPYPNDDNKEWYWTNAERNSYMTSAGREYFSDTPQTSVFRLNNNVTSIRESFNLELVRVPNTSASGGGDVVLRLNWGYQFDAKSQTLIPIR